MHLTLCARHTHRPPPKKNVTTLPINIGPSKDFFTQLWKLAWYTNSQLTWIASVCSRGVIQDKNAGEIRVYSGQIFRITIEIHRTVLKVEGRKKFMKFVAIDYYHK